MTETDQQLVKLKSIAYDLNTNINVLQHKLSQVNQTIMQLTQQAEVSKTLPQPISELDAIDIEKANAEQN